MRSESPILPRAFSDNPNLIIEAIREAKFPCSGKVQIYAHLGDSQWLYDTDSSHSASAFSLAPIDSHRLTGFQEPATRLPTNEKLMFMDAMFSTCTSVLVDPLPKALDRGSASVAKRLGLFLFLYFLQSTHTS